jgi:DNA-binding transcriptional ArsR family regulator
MWITTASARAHSGCGHSPEQGAGARPGTLAGVGAGAYPWVWGYGSRTPPSRPAGARLLRPWGNGYRGRPSTPHERPATTVSIEPDPAGPATPAPGPRALSRAAREPSDAKVRARLATHRAWRSDDSLEERRDALLASAVCSVLLGRGGVFRGESDVSGELDSGEVARVSGLSARAVRRALALLGQAGVADCRWRGASVRVRFDPEVTDRAADVGRIAWDEVLALLAGQGAAILVVRALATSSRGIPWPYTDAASVAAAEMAEETGYSIDSVLRGLRAAEEAGVISSERREGGPKRYRFTALARGVASPAAPAAVPDERPAEVPFRAPVLPDSTAPAHPLVAGAGADGIWVDLRGVLLHIAAGSEFRLPPGRWTPEVRPDGSILFRLG